MDEHELIEELDEFGGGLIIFSGEEVALIKAFFGELEALGDDFHQFLLFHLQLYVPSNISRHVKGRKELLRGCPWRSICTIVSLLIRRLVHSLQWSVVLPCPTESVLCSIRRSRLRSVTTPFCILWRSMVILCR
jgi:hypothetical protein